MSKTVNILGDTPKQQWLNAITIFETCIYENARSVREDLNYFDRDFDDGSCEERLDVVMRTVKNFACEMRRLVDGITTATEEEEE